MDSQIFQNVIRDPTPDKVTDVMSEITPDIIADIMPAIFGEVDGGKTSEKKARIQNWFTSRVT